MSDVPNNPLSPRHVERRARSLNVAVLLVGFLMLGAYLFAAVFVPGHKASCDFSISQNGVYRGGQASGGSALSALLIAGALWLAVNVLAAWLAEARVRLLLTCFVVWYAVGLGVLWALAPHVWGTRVWGC
jgi:hypothetical protein